MLESLCASVLTSDGAKPTLVLKHPGGVFRWSCRLIAAKMTALLGGDPTLKGFRAGATTDNPHAVVSYVLPGAEAHNPFLNVVRAGVVVAWVTEHVGSPRYKKIWDMFAEGVASAGVSVPHWVWVTLSKDDASPDCDAEGITVWKEVRTFMWDVPDVPSPLRYPDMTLRVVCVFLDAGRRSRFTAALAKALRRVQGVSFAVVSGIRDRDAALASADVVVNVHARVTMGGFECHRVSRCLAFGCAVLSEYTSDALTLGKLGTLRKDGLKVAPMSADVTVAPAVMDPAVFAQWVAARVADRRDAGVFGKPWRKARQAKFYEWWRAAKDGII